MVCPSCFQLRDQLAQVAGRLRVQAQGGLIQQQDGRVGDQGLADRHALLHAGGKLLHQVIGARGQLHAIEQLADALFGDIGRDVIQGGEVFQVLARGQFPVDAALAGQKRAQVLAHLVGLFDASRNR